MGQEIQSNVTLFTGLHLGPVTLISEGVSQCLIAEMLCVGRGWGGLVYYQRGIIFPQWVSSVMHSAPFLPLACFMTLICLIS